TTPGNYIRGTSTGSSTSAGATSLDQFHLRMPAATLGIYRNRLTFDSYVSTGQTASIRGLVVNLPTAGTWPSCGSVATSSGLDDPVQTSSTGRFSQWYSFGKQEE